MDQEKIENAVDEKGGIRKYLLPGILILILFFIALYMLSLFTDTQEQMTKSEKQVETLSSELKQLQENKASSDTDKETESDSQEMVVVFVPGGLFEDSEKENLQEKLINPFEDYERDILNSNPLTMEIEKEENAGYSYSVSVIFEDGQHNGFLYGQEDPLEWWKPTCMGECEFTDEYSQKYPEVVN